MRKIYRVTLTEEDRTTLQRLLAGGTAVVRAAGDDPVAQLRALIAWQVDFALDNPALITVQDRDLASLPEADAAQVRRLQRRYVEVWVEVLGRVHPASDAATNRARAHAVFGLINSTPHNRLLPDDDTRRVLATMALAALR